MTKDEIKRNAPPTATHYLTIGGEVVYYRYPFNFLCQYWNGKYWIKGNMHTHKKKL